MWGETSNAAPKTKSGVEVGNQPAFQPRDRILDQQFALLQPLDRQLVNLAVGGESFDRDIEVAVFDPQLGQLMHELGRVPSFHRVASARPMRARLQLTRGGRAATR